MKILAAIISLLLLLTSIPAFSQSPTTDILSKDDARAMFAMSKSEWTANVRHAIDAGAARAAGTQTMPAMGMRTPDGDFLIVQPNYGENDQKPDFIQVTVGYPHPRSTLLTESGLREAIRAAEVQMAPEYKVIGNINRIEGGISVIFAIFEKN